MLHQSLTGSIQRQHNHHHSVVPLSSNELWPRTFKFKFIRSAAIASPAIPIQSSHLHHPRHLRGMPVFFRARHFGYYYTCPSVSIMAQPVSRVVAVISAYHKFSPLSPFISIPSHRAAVGVPCKTAAGCFRFFAVWWRRTVAVSM